MPTTRPFATRVSLSQFWSHSARMRLLFHSAAKMAPPHGLAVTTYRYTAAEADWRHLCGRKETVRKKFGVEQGPGTTAVTSVTRRQPFTAIVDMFRRGDRISHTMGTIQPTEITLVYAPRIMITLKTGDFLSVRVRPGAADHSGCRSFVRAPQARRP